MKQSQFVGTTFWFLLQELSPPLHSFKGLKETEQYLAQYGQEWVGLRLGLWIVTV